MIISIIAAVAKNRVIGNKNAMPWHLPADFKHFKEKTINKTIVLGLNTFKSIGEKPLPNRKHIILSKDVIEDLPNGCYWAKSIDEALEIAKNIDARRLYNSTVSNEELMVCGGAQVYKQFLPLADRMYLTYIHQNFEGDTFFPEFNKDDWQEVNREDHQPDPSISSGQGKNKYNYSFVVLERKKRV